MKQFPLFEQEQPLIRLPEQSARVLSKKEKRIAKIILEIEKAKLPLKPEERNPEKDYISITPQQMSSIYSDLVKEETPLKGSLSKEEFEEIHVSPHDIMSYLEVLNIKVETPPSDWIEKGPRSTKRIIRPVNFTRTPVPRHPPMLSYKDLAAGEKPYESEN